MALRARKVSGAFEKRAPGSNNDAVHCGIVIIATVSTISEASIVGIELRFTSAFMVAIANVAEELLCMIATLPTVELFFCDHSGGTDHMRPAHCSLVETKLIVSLGTTR